MPIGELIHYAEGMTNTARKMVRLTAGDLEGMDAGQLREHLTEYFARTTSSAASWHAYVNGICRRISRLTGEAWGDIFDRAERDAADLDIWTTP